MPDITSNLGLKKPLGNETVSRAAYNENLDILDQNAVKKGNGIGELSGGTLVSRPAASTAGRYYFAQDTGEIYLDTGTEWVLAAAGQVDLANLQNTVSTHLADLMPHDSGLNSYASAKDVNGIYTVVDYKRADGTLYMKSTLSGGTSPNYTTDTWLFYNTDGATLISTKTWTITYDTDGNITSKVVV